MSSDPDIDAAFKRITDTPELADLAEHKLPEPSREGHRNRLARPAWVVVTCFAVAFVLVLAGITGRL